MTQNQIAYKNARELERHNKAAEVENERHQKTMEAYEAWKNKLTAIANEETARANRAREAETNRTNLANEEINRQRNAINSVTAAETQRHNIASEQLTQSINSSQAALNSALAGNASASAALSYANIPYVAEKAQTENTMQILNTAKATTERYQPSYVLTQNELNRAKIRQTGAETQRVQVQTVHEGVNTLWDSVKNAISVFMGVKVRSK